MDVVEYLMYVVVLAYVLVVAVNGDEEKWRVLSC
jgi:hypothetical protein